MAAAFPESQVVRIWQDCLPGRTDLVTEDGGPVEIIYPGRLNDDCGADLRDAVIATDGRLQKGDVEVHVKSSSWWGHRHHQNPLFNGVILHVVYWHDIAAVVTLQNGRRVPTLALRRYFEGRKAVSPSPRRPMPCRAAIGRRAEGVTGRVLDAAGDRRFFARVAELGEELHHDGAAPVLYRGIMGALGYTKNKLPMRELARRMPLPRLLALARDTASREERLARYQALLMGTAGLLPSQQGGKRGHEPSEGWVARLEETWAAFGKGAVMSPDDWHSFKVRPGNLPRRRVAAMSYLLLRYGEEGLPDVLVRGVENASPDGGRSSPGEWLLVSAAGYWGENTDFGLPAGRSVPALLGRNRAEVIVVNVLLPFAAAWGEETSRPDIAARAKELYQRYPAITENSLEKHMRRQLGISRCTVGSARRQQGIIHIYKTLCSQGKCAECPLG
jgi:hypothetical protein